MEKIIAAVESFAAAQVVVPPDGNQNIGQIREMFEAMAQQSAVEDVAWMHDHGLLLDGEYPILLADRLDLLTTTRKPIRSIRGSLVGVPDSARGWISQVRHGTKAHIWIAITNYGRIINVEMIETTPGDSNYMKIRHICENIGLARFAPLGADLPDDIPRDTPSNRRRPVGPAIPIKMSAIWMGIMNMTVPESGGGGCACTEYTSWVHGLSDKDETSIGTYSSLTGQLVTEHPTVKKFLTEHGEKLVTSRGALARQCGLVQSADMKIIHMGMATHEYGGLNVSAGTPYGGVHPFTVALRRYAARDVGVESTISESNKSIIETMSAKLARREKAMAEREQKLARQVKEAADREELMAEREKLIKDASERLAAEKVSLQEYATEIASAAHIVAIEELRRRAKRNWAMTRWDTVETASAEVIDLANKVLAACENCDMNPVAAADQCRAVISTLKGCKTMQMPQFSTMSEIVSTPMPPMVAAATRTQNDGTIVVAGESFDVSGIF